MPVKKGSSGISRRDFLKGMGTTILSTAVVTGGGLVPDSATAALLDDTVETISGRVKISLRVNHKVYSVAVEPRTTLLEVLRERLGLTGAKPACNRGECGACTVLVDNQPMLACSLLAVDVRDADIITVEGLSTDDTLTAVQKAFVEKDGLMCGFCTPGFVVAATALLQKNPNPSLSEIKQGLSGNLCRCAAYPKIFEAVQQAARTMQRGK
ncbi:MAG: (2Fe-2S)-binding protein [Calditrichaeota bacterium]|nr:(2Fe-2S)-binding protein [Calditrichota bacterium]